MIVTRIDVADLDTIEPLWNELKNYHQQKTIDFDRYYESSNFTKRKAELLAKDQLAVFVINDLDKVVGFCVSSINKQFGEIDSLYVLPKSRNKGCGLLLLERAMYWLKLQEPTAIRLSVGQGNEDVIKYYEKLGFKKRATLLELFE